MVHQELVLQYEAKLRNIKINKENVNIKFLVPELAYLDERNEQEVEELWHMIGSDISCWSKY